MQTFQLIMHASSANLHCLEMPFPTSKVMHGSLSFFFLCKKEKVSTTLKSDYLSDCRQKDQWLTIPRLLLKEQTTDQGVATACFGDHNTMKLCCFVLQEWEYHQSNNKLEHISVLKCINFCFKRCSMKCFICTVGNDASVAAVEMVKQQDPSSRSNNASNYKKAHGMHALMLK